MHIGSRKSYLVHNLYIWQSISKAEKPALEEVDSYKGSWNRQQQTESGPW
ncbi:unnamed protein product [Brassica oleracea]|uniref:Uncharacterized protein n=2 Tax=Brassica TaxID=3705 RepID=A0A3P6DAA1_BRAOL|nr:unnamed protein product [Brassica napus]VDD21204.1 unnamed protein product [Brassica oleracea]